MTFTSRPFEESHVPAIVDLMNIALGDREGRARDTAYWRWKHLENPFGQSIIRLAFDGEKLIAFRAFMRWRFVRAGQNFEAVRAVDTATHPDYQRRGLFSRLAREALEDCRQAGIDFVFNTPNQNSYPGYIKLGWRDIGLLRMAVRPVRPLHWIVRLAGIGSSERAWLWPIGGNGASNRELIEASNWRPCAADAAYLQTDYSSDYLRWRYLDNPIADYHLQMLEDGGVALLLIARGKARSGARELLIADCLTTNPAHPRRKMIRQALHDLVDSVDTEYLIRHQPESEETWPGFFAVPRKGMRLTHKPVNHNAEVTVTDFKLSLGDIEIF